MGDYFVVIYNFDNGDIILNSETQNAYTVAEDFCNTAIYSEEFPVFFHWGITQLSGAEELLMWK